jgi:hypothetical protein
MENCVDDFPRHDAFPKLTAIDCQRVGMDIYLIHPRNLLIHLVIPGSMWYGKESR